jgi:hypothetical protein
MIPANDTHLTPEEMKEIDAIMKENIYYNLEDVMTYLRMRDTIKIEPTYV